MALALGKSLKWVRKRDADELLEWQMVDRIHPFGDRRADYRAGMAANAIRASNGAEQIDLEKFVMEHRPDEQPQDVTEDDVTELFGFDFGGG